MIRTHEIQIDTNTIQVLIIETSNKTPFYLTEDYVDSTGCADGKTRKIRACCVYTRVGDKNTDIDKSADIDKVEYLWRKRFGLDKSIMERLHIVLDDWENWGTYSYSFNSIEFQQGGDWGNQEKMINIQFPEFRIEIDKDSHREWYMETMLCFYMNPTAGHYEAKVFYNNTELCRFILAHVDEYRKYLVMPRTGSFSNNERHKEKGGRYDVCFGDEVRFYYLLKDSIEGKVQKIITHGTFNTESRGGEKWWMLVFDDNAEYQEFITYAEANPQLYKIGLKSYDNTEGKAHIPIGDTYNAYRFYVEFMLNKGKKTRADFGRYFDWYDHLVTQNDSTNSSTKLIKST